MRSSRRMIANFNEHLTEVSVSYLSDPVVELEKDNEYLSKMREGEGLPNLRVWSGTPSVIVSRRESKLSHFEKAAVTFKDLGWPIAVRSSGGSICPLGPGVLNLSLVTLFKFRGGFSVDASYSWFCSRLLQSVSALGVECGIGSVEGCYCDGNYNVVVSGKKVIGTSQRFLPVTGVKGAAAMLMHATILVSANKERLCDLVNTFNAITKQEVSVSANALVNLAEMHPSSTTEQLKNSFIKNVVKAFCTESATQ